MRAHAISRLIALFSKFPTVGQRTAERFALYVLKLSQSDTQELVGGIEALRSSVGLCAFCFQPFDKEEDEKQRGLCSVCRDAKRDGSTLCIVEKETDLEALERTHSYTGLYFILGGTVNQLKKHDLDSLRVEELKKRLVAPQNFGMARIAIREIILAMNPTLEGEATASYLGRLLKGREWNVTRIGKGLPMGGEMEYADDETLTSSLEGRR